MLIYNVIGFPERRNAELARTKKALKCHQTLSSYLGVGSGDEINSILA